MKIAVLLTGCLLAAPALAQPTENPPLIRNGPVTVTAEDFKAFLLRVPEENRAEFVASVEKIGKAVELVYSNRVLANEAKKLGLDKSPEIQLRMKQIQESYLAQLWTENYRRTADVPDLTARAEELYKVHKDRYSEPARFSGKYILLQMKNRTRDEALSYARELLELIRKGARFDDLMAQFTEDPIYGRTLGRFNRLTAKDVEKPIADAVFALNSPGDVTPPVETKDAVFLVQLENKSPARVIPFSEVKNDLIEQEKSRYLADATDRRIGELKNTGQTTVYSDNIAALKVDIPRDKLQEAAEKARAVAPTPTR